MTKTIRKTSIVLALLMAILMVFTLLPLNVKAQESIEITQADLDAVGPDKESHVDLEKGIEYFPSGFFQLYKSAEYVLAGDIELKDQTLDISSENGPSVLNLNGHSISAEGCVTETSGDSSITYGAVTCTRDSLTIKGNGTITADSDAQYALNALKGITIEGGTYNGDIAIGLTPLNTIKGGTFNGELFITADTYINGGTFNDAVSSWNGSTIIYDGEFQAAYLQGDSAILMILGGSFYNTCIFEAGNGYIYGGNFEYKGDSQMIINLTGGALEIWGGEFYNSEDSENAPAVDIIYSSPENNKNASLIVNGGYFGIAEKYSIFAWGLDYLSVSGGEFVSKGYALGIVDDGNIKVEISGGNFTSLGNWSLSYAPSAAIVSAFQNTEYKDNIFESYLLDGYEYVPKVETNKATGDAGELAAYTQKEISVLPAEATASDDEVVPSNTPSTGDSGYGGWICLGLLAAGALVITPLVIKKKGVLDE